MIKRTYLITMIALFLSLNLMAQRKRALLVGISHYQTALTAYEWEDIHGANDVALLCPILKSKGFEVETLTETQATHDNIIKKLNNLILTAKKGDIVYFHFSGHGQPVEDRNGDEADGWDEAIIPINAHKIYKKGIYEGQNHIIDDELGKLVSHLRTAVGPKGIVYVTIDACHAGTASRGDDATGEESPSIRGTIQGFAYTKGKIYKPLKVEQANYYKVPKSNQMANVVFFESCRPYQSNHEITVGKKVYGPLSYHLSLTFLQTNKTSSPQLLISRLRQNILKKGLWPTNQNLVIEKSF